MLAGLQFHHQRSQTLGRRAPQPRYILNLLLSIINVSVQTVDIVERLPPVDWQME